MHAAIVCMLCSNMSRQRGLCTVYDKLQGTINMKMYAFQTFIYNYIVGCKHRASEGVFYIGGRGCVLCQFIEAVTFARCAFIFALRNITLGRYLDTRRNI